MSEPGAQHEPRLRLELEWPAGAIPRWLLDALLGLEQAGAARLQVRRGDAAEVAKPGTSGLSLQRVAAPVEGLADVDVAARLVCWELSAAAAPDVVLQIGPDALPDRFGVAAPLRWALSDGAGACLSAQWPLLREITGGSGIALQCMQRHPPSASGWAPRRTLHLAADSRYAHGIEGLAGAVRRLLSQSCVDLRLGASLSGAPVAAPLAAPAVGAARAGAARIAGHLRAWIDRQRARLLSETWRIGVIDAPVQQLLAPGPLPRVRWLTAGEPEGSWADPFGMPGDTERLFAEFLDRRSGIGHIELLQLGREGEPPRRQPVAIGDGGHVSFPLVFDCRGRRLGIAETLSLRQCVLHAVDADGHWRPLWPLLQDVAAADAVPFQWEGRHWLAYTDTDIGLQDNLCLCHAERLEGPWTPHANNPVKTDVRGARMAGNLFWHEGALYRPGQDCLKTYGAATVLYRIVSLTPTQFVEVPVRRLDPDAAGPCPHGLHTVSAWGDRTLIDGKRLGFDLPALRHKFALRRTGLLGATVPTDRLMIYVPHLRTGGGEISMLQLAQGFAAAGRNVELVVHTLRTRELDIPPGVTVTSLGPEGTARALWRLVRLLRQRQPRWLLSAFPHSNVAAVAAVTLARSGTEVIATEHAPLSIQIQQQSGWRWRVLLPLVRWAYRRAAAVVGVSEGVRADLVGLVGPTLAPAVIGNPVLAPGFEAESRLPPDHPWLLDRALQVVLSVSRLAPEKDLPTLVRAFAAVHRRQPSTRLLMAGEGPERAALQALVQQLGLQHVVQLPGRTRQPLRWMRGAAVFVLASRFEGFGNVLIEALACGTPVVATDCPVGPREILRGGRYGALVPVGDCAAMAVQIERALADPVPPPGAIEAAQAHSRDDACAAYLGLFDSLERRRVLPTC